MSIELLKKAADLYGQRKTGSLIGKSASTVNLLLKGTYPNPKKILLHVQTVFSNFEGVKYECPVIGTVHKDVCIKYQRWSKENKVHKDRLYMQVKAYCSECKYKGIHDE